VPVVRKGAEGHLQRSVDQYTAVGMTMPMAVPLAIISSGRKMNLATMLIMVAMRERRMPGTLRLISIRRSTFRLCSSSNPNFAPDRIARFNVHSRSMAKARKLFFCKCLYYVYSFE